VAPPALVRRFGSVARVLWITRVGVDDRVRCKVEVLRIPGEFGFGKGKPYRPGIPAETVDHGVVERAQPCG
jgi:hypothetical protein